VLRRRPEPVKGADSALSTVGCAGFARSPSDCERSNEFESFGHWLYGTNEAKMSVGFEVDTACV
jgi:hypothetical protein